MSRGHEGAAFVQIVGRRRDGADLLQRDPEPHEGAEEGGRRWEAMYIKMYIKMYKLRYYIIYLCSGECIEEDIRVRD